MVEKETYRIEPEIGSNEWFKQEAWRSLKQTQESGWDFSDSALIYTNDATDSYQELQSEGTAYAEQITGEEHELFKTTAADVMRDVPDIFSYLDLGPGTEHKERYFFDAARDAGKSFEYYPVDINRSVLEKSRQLADDQKISVHPICSRFEDLEEKQLVNIPTPRFVSLGATFANYKTDEVLRILLSLAGVDGSAMFTAQLRDRIDLEKVKETYREPAAIKIYEAKLALLGLVPEDVDRFVINDEIVVSAVVKKPTDKLKTMGMRPGDKIDVLRTYRLSEKELLNALGGTAFNIFDKGKSFVVVQIKQKANSAR